MTFSVDNQLQYTPREAFKRCQEGAVILDIRPELLCAYKAFDAPQVLYCPWQEIGQYLDNQARLSGSCMCQIKFREKNVKRDAFRFTIKINVNFS